MRFRDATNAATATGASVAFALLTALLAVIAIVL
jgi:hypothetical protein